MPNELFQHSGLRRFAFLEMAAAGLLIPALATMLIRWTGTYDFLYFVLIGVGYGSIAFFLARQLSHRLIVNLVALYGLLPFASLLDVAIDTFITHHSRNLWGLEVLVLLAAVPFPLMIGALVGRRYRRFDLKSED